MSNKIFRISTTLTAIILAAGIIAALLLLGKATRGPLSNFFSFFNPNLLSFLNFPFPRFKEVKEYRIWQKRTRFFPLV